jgi:two-component system, OmpR family, sensor histidine kinase ChvG
MSERFRSWLGLRGKMLLLSSFLLVLPWLGYRYILEMEGYLARGQGQVVLGTARALAAALSERPELFNTGAWSRARLSQDLYVYPVFHPLNIEDDSLLDWRDYQQYEQYWREGMEQPYPPNLRSTYRDGGRSDPLNFHLMLGENSQHLYLYVRVEDRYPVLRDRDSVRLDQSDALHLALTNPFGDHDRFIIAPQGNEFVQAYRTGRDHEDISAHVHDPRISGKFRLTLEGYEYELSLPMELVGEKLGIALYDVDDPATRKLEAIVATSGIHTAPSLGTLQRPTGEINRIVAGMGHANSLVRVIDSSQRVLLSNGSIETASGLMLVEPETEPDGPWSWLRHNILRSLYQSFLTRPTMDYVQDLYESGIVEGELAMSALTGLARVGFQTLPGAESDTRILQAAWPITVEDKVLGAVVVDQNMNGIHTFRNQALQLLFDTMLGILLVTVLGLFLFASKLTKRIRALSSQAERIIDDKGRFTNTIVPSRSLDEIGDLSRSFANIVDRLGQYTHYLENMSSRLSHELRTPVTVVRSSLENLSLVTDDKEALVYIQRAEEGIGRLNLILNNMSEAARLEQILQTTDKELMELNRVVEACVAEYRQIYPHTRIDTSISQEPVWVFGTPEYIAQLMDKIVANAVDFATTGTPVQVNCFADSGEAVISVSNQGPWLDPGMKARIFDSMVSVRPAGKKKIPHLGMGLHIARMIAEYHGGYINADNLISESGVIVVVRLPLHQR